MVVLNLGCGYIFLKMVENIISPKLSIIFLELIRRGSFPESWRSANIAIPKGGPSSDI